MSFAVEIRDLTVRYGRTTAVDALDLTVQAGSITGLIGRNGSGKTTLLSTVAAFRRPSAGTVLVDGEEPWENPRVMAGTCLIREGGDVVGEQRVREVLRTAAGDRELFSPELAGRLVDAFEIDVRGKVSQLSRGKRSALGVVVGLASRAPLTLLDEVHLGMDAPSRYAFYDALLTDYVEHPRTIVLSSHLIEEIQRLVEHVVVMHRGGVLVAAEAETLRARGTTVTGPADVVADFTAHRTVIGRSTLGRTVQATLYGHLSQSDVAFAREHGLDLGPVDLQDLFVHLTGPDGPSALSQEVAS